MSNYWDQVQIEALVNEASQTGSAERLRGLVYSHPEVTQAIAKNPRAPADLLLDLSKRDDHQLKLALLQNIALPPACFATLATNMRYIARALAVCPRTPPDILKSLGQNSDRAVLVGVAQNLQTPPEVLEDLSNNRFSEVYKAAQKNPNNPLYVGGTPNRRWTRNARPQDGGALDSAPDLIIDTMVRSSNSQERHYAALRGRLSSEQMSILSRDPELFVREALSRSQPLPEEILGSLLQQNDENIRRELAYNTRLSEEQQRSLLGLMLQSNERQRSIAAWNPLLSTEQKQELSQDPSGAVRSNLAGNRNLTPDIIERLANDLDESVRQALRYNTSVSEEIRARVTATLPQYDPAPLTTDPQAPTWPSAEQPEARLKPKMLGVGFLMVSLALILLYSLTGQSLYFIPIVSFIFLGLAVFSMDATKQERERRRLIGLLMIIASIVSLPILLMLGAPPFIVGACFFFIILGFFMMITV